MTILLRTLSVIGCVCVLSGFSVQAQFSVGLYRDGKLVENLGTFSPPSEPAKQSKARTKPGAPEFSPPASSFDTQKRNQTVNRATATAREIRRELMRLSKAKETAAAAADFERLRILLPQFIDGQREVRSVLEETGRRIRTLSLPSTIYARHRKTVLGFDRGMLRFTNTLNAVLSGKAGAAGKALALADELKIGVEPELKQTEPTQQAEQIRQAPELSIEQANALLQEPPLAPTNRTKPPRSPAKALPPPVAADLLPTVDVQITQEITNKAVELGNSPLAIYEFVRNNVSFQPYLGSRKGSVETLRQRAGNDTDQASLLLALLRAAGVPCRYARGTVEMTPDQAKKWTGVDHAQTAGSILTTAGLDGVNIVNGPNVVAVRCTRVWVEAYVPYSNYRGLPEDNTGKTWVPLDPTFKETAITPGQDVLAAMGLNMTQFLAAYIATPGLTNVSPIEHLDATIQTWLNANQPGTTVADVERQIALVPQNLGLLPASAPFQQITAPTRFSELEDNKRYKVRFRLYNGGTTFIDYTANLCEFITKRVTIEYIGATPADQATIDTHGGIYQTPPNLVNVKPVLQLDDVPVQTSANSIGMGRTHSSDMHFTQPTGAQNVQPLISNTIIAGNGQAIAFDTFLDVRNPLLFGGSSSNLLKSVLHSTAVDYLSRVDRGQEKGGRLLRAVTTEDVSEAIVENSVSVAFSFGTPVTFEWTGLIVDADRRIVGTFPVDGNNAKNVPYMLLTGYDGSSMENRVFEDTFDQEAVSTIKILHVSGSMGIPICYITNSIASACPGFSQSASIISAVNSALSQGHVVIIPRSPITYGEWSGTGYIDLNPATGAAGYIISGGINGSISVNGGATVDEWPIDLGCAPIGPVTGTITPGGFTDGGALCAGNSYIGYGVDLAYDCQDANGNVQHQTFGASHQIPITTLAMANTYGLGTYTISIPGAQVQPVTFKLVGEVIAIGSRRLNDPALGIFFGHMSMERWVPDCSSAQLDELEVGTQYTTQQLNGAGYSKIGEWELLKNGGGTEGGYVVDRCILGVPAGTISVDISTIHAQSHATEHVIVRHQADTASEWTTVSQNASAYGFAEQTGFNGSFQNWPNSRYGAPQPLGHGNNSNTFIQWLANASGITFIDPPARSHPGNNAPQNLGHPFSSCGGDPH